MVPAAARGSEPIEQWEDLPVVVDVNGASRYRLV
jgi:hypothetical protein